VQFSLRALINDGLMTIFFFVVGMEIKRELATGELNTTSKALLPAVAAVGGMALPAALFAAINRHGTGRAGWGIPMATDIAFCIGVLTLLKRRVPRALIVFVTALAIFDDIGGILVIAIFYGESLHFAWLLGAGFVSLLLFAMNRAYVGNGFVYAVLGGVLWYALHSSGVHATISGVILGAAIPARPQRDAREVLAELGAYANALHARDDEELCGAELRMIDEKLEEIEAPLHRFVHTLHPLMAFGIMPLFALANSGVSLRGFGIDSLLAPVTLGAALGLFVGKQLGIFSFTVLAVKLRLAPMPGNASLRKLFGVSVMAGIGFTVALFIAALAYRQTPLLLDQAKLGIVLGSLASGLGGYVLLRMPEPTLTFRSAPKTTPDPRSVRT
jgi:NhaA family Na+:H+ antiporter